uniref:Uncharacterized protein n=1 Tax=Ananas comosus var. bracteatus TaxID=296719 RepID=A0A6V7Q1R2_ANACO|nr:unnamed protein product [Ananas comosus var. bracteatus]
MKVLEGLPYSSLLRKGLQIGPLEELLGRFVPFGRDDHGIYFAGGDLNEGSNQMDPHGWYLASRVNHQGGVTIINKSIDDDATELRQASTALELGALSQAFDVATLKKALMAQSRISRKFVGALWRMESFRQQALGCRNFSHLTGSWAFIKIDSDHKKGRPLDYWATTWVQPVNPNALGLWIATNSGALFSRFLGLVIGWYLKLVKALSCPASNEVPNKGSNVLTFVAKLRHCNKRIKDGVQRAFTVS